MKKAEKFPIEVYLDDGRVFEYSVDSEGKVREHAFAIVATGYRHTYDGVFEHYPPHRIVKVKSRALSTKYTTDTVRGT